jgi:hypothetical protein
MQYGSVCATVRSLWTTQRAVLRWVLLRRFPMLFRVLLVLLSVSLLCGCPAPTPPADVMAESSADASTDVAPMPTDVMDVGLSSDVMDEPMSVDAGMPVDAMVPADVPDVATDGSADSGS